MIDYNTEFKPQDLYSGDMFRSSDHDPVLVGMNLAAPAQSQAITFAPLADLPAGSAPFGVTASASSLLPVVFSSTTPLVCSVAGSSVTLLSVGVCTITVDQPGNPSFLPAPQVVRSFTVLPASQSIKAQGLVVTIPATVDGATVEFPGTNFAGAPITAATMHALLDENAAPGGRDAGTPLHRGAAAADSHAGPICSG